MLELTSGKLETVRLKGRTVKYRVRHSPSAKRRRLQVSPGGVVVVLPKSDSASGAADFIRKNAVWVTQEIGALSRRANSISAASGSASMLLCGELVRVVCASAQSRRSHIDISNHQVILQIPSGVDPTARLEQWLRQIARREIQRLLKTRANELGVKPKRIFIRGQRTRWGSCSRLQNLSFNWRLAMMPPDVIDYLVVHELIHLKEMSHSPKFWLLVRQACPGYARQLDWLKRNTHRLCLPTLCQPK